MAAKEKNKQVDRNKLKKGVTTCILSIGFSSIAERGRYVSIPAEDKGGNLPTLSGGGASMLVQLFATIVNL